MVQGQLFETRARYDLNILLKLKVRKCWGLIPTFKEVTRKKLDRRGFFVPSPPIQDNFNLKLAAQKYIYICTT